MAVILAALAAAGAVFAWLRFRSPPAAPAPVSSSSAQASKARRAPPADARKSAHGALRGKVVEPGGAAVAGATVCARGSSSRLSDTELGSPTCVTADPQGRWELAALWPARYEVFASAQGHRPARFRAPPPSRSTSVSLEAGAAVNDVDLTLEPGGVEVKGHVKDLSGGVVGNALVLLVDLNPGGHGGTTAIARTDAQGAYRAWVSEGPYHATANADGYAEGSRTGAAPGAPIEILLTPESILVGRVFEAGGDDPVPNAKVSLSSEEGEPSTLSDAEGRFTIKKLSPGRYKPSATAPGRYGQAKESVLLGLGETSKEVRVDVHPAFDVAGRVVLAAGGPCPEGSVTLVDRARNRSREALLDKNGAARLEGLSPGTYEVKPSCKGKVPEDRYPPVEVKGADVEGLTWSVREGVTITGRVVDKHDQPVSASVRAAPKGTDPRAQRTNAFARTEPDGAFTLEGLLPGTYLLNATVKDHPNPEPVEADAGPGRGREVKIVVEEGGGIEGKVESEDGQPVADVSVTASGPKLRWVDARTQPDGTFKLEGLAPGDYRVEASRSGDSLRAPGKKDDDVTGTPATVKAGAVVRVKLVVEKAAGEIRGQVADAQGQPVTDAFLDAEREPDRAGAAAGSAVRSSRWGFSRSPSLTDLEGKFTLGDLVKGLYTVRAHRKGGGETFVEHVQVGQTVTLTMRPEGAVLGTVSAGDQPPERFTVRLVDRHTGFSRSEEFFRTAGSWAIRDVPAGNFELSADAPEGTVSTTVELKDGEERSDLVLKLTGRATITGTVVALDDQTPVAGIRVSVTPRKGGGWAGGSADPDRNYITDAQGRFRIERAPVGPAILSLSPVDRNGDFGFAQVPAEIPEGAAADVGQLLLPRRRLGPNDRGGDLGFDLAARTPGIDPADVKLTVSFVRPDGPAAQAGLQAGDIITSVDGHDVKGSASYLYGALTRVAEGTAISVGLARGQSVQITAGKRP